jgi:hypothetical protein
MSRRVPTVFRNVTATGEAGVSVAEHVRTRFWRCGGEGSGHGWEAGGRQAAGRTALASGVWDCGRIRFGYLSLSGLFDISVYGTGQGQGQGPQDGVNRG